MPKNSPLESAVTRQRSNNADNSGSLTIIYRPVDELVPYDKNARTHSERQIEQIAASVTEFGWTNPVLISETGGVIAGHGRLAAARKLGMAEVPTITLAGLTEAQRRALVIADNQLAISGAAWDDDLLRLELGELAADGFDLDLIGFDPAEIALLLADPLAEGGAADGSGSGAGSLAERFGVPPFSVLNAREGWWQDRKREWLAIGIQSELGRGENHGLTNGSRQSMEYVGGFKPRHGMANAEPGGSKMPAADYSKNRARGTGRGRAVAK